MHGTTKDFLHNFMLFLENEEQTRKKKTRMFFYSIENDMRTFAKWWRHTLNQNLFKYDGDSQFESEMFDSLQ